MGVKKVIFLSNYFNHHQKPFSETMCDILGDGYKFIETEPMEEERVKMGWKVENFPPYVITFDEYEKRKNECIDLINNADAVIIGSAPNSLVEERIKNNDLVFRSAERIFKRKSGYLKWPVRFYRWHKMNPKNKKIFMLCSSAYTAKDFATLGLFKNKCFKWGYFPETIKYDNIDQLVEEKEKNSIVWVGRFIDWKHPEIAIKLAKKLKKDGYDFKLNMIGNGSMLEKIKKKVLRLGLEENVKVLGAMKPEEVRGYMEKSQIHLFTSNRREGWGAVLNESMNSGCVAIANEKIGSAPYLVEDGENGFTYKSIKQLYKKIKMLLSDSEKIKAISKKAYETITNQWNAENAAQRFISLAEKTLNNEKMNVFETGIGSLA